MGEQSNTAPIGREAVYVVQRMEDVEVVVNRKHAANGANQSPPPKPEVVTEKRGYWMDVATVSVPAKSKRKTIIGLALVQAEIKPQPGDEPLRLRVLPAAAAAVTTVAAKAVEPQLEMS